MWRVLLFSSIAVVCAIQVSKAQTSQPKVMQSFPEPDLTEQVIGGIPARPSDWPATLVFSAATGSCTSTVVGEEVLLTAAHCVDHGGFGRVRFGGDDYITQCFHHPKYRGPDCSNLNNTWAQLAGCTADIALCFPMRRNANVLEPAAFTLSFAQFERVRKSPPSPQKDDTVKLVGWGCTSDGGPLSPVLLTSQPDPRVLYASTPGAADSDKAKSYLEFIKTIGPGAVCRGDSGGAVFSRAGPGREIVAVVSRGNMSSESYLANILEHQQFLRSDYNSRRRYICGLDPEARNCRP